MAEGPMAHAHSEFTFTVQAPMAEAFPLFGAEGERAWGGPHWDPQFVYPDPASAPGPVPARDVEGAVFRVHHGHHSATWVNTAFDAQAGHAAYVYIVDGKLATRIDVQLSPIDIEPVTGKQKFHVGTLVATSAADLKTFVGSYYSEEALATQSAE